MNRFKQEPGKPFKTHLRVDGNKALCKYHKYMQPPLLTEKLENVDCKNCLNKLAKYPK